MSLWTKFNEYFKSYLSLFNFIEIWNAANWYFSELSWKSWWAGLHNQSKRWTSRHGGYYQANSSKNTKFGARHLYNLSIPYRDLTKWSFFVLPSKLSDFFYFCALILLISCIKLNRGWSESSYMLRIIKIRGLSMSLSYCRTK